MKMLCVVSVYTPIPKLTKFNVFLQNTISMLNLNELFKTK